MFKLLLIISVLWSAWELDLASDCDGHYCDKTKLVLTEKGN